MVKVDEAIAIVEDICDHIRVSKLLAVDHHREGICQPVAYQCDDYASFTKGFCASCNNNECRPFGLSIQFDVNVRIPQSEVADKGYYFKTSGKSPYCGMLIVSTKLEQNAILKMIAKG
ncbi:lipoxygenase-like protein [Leptotrombidium deliense]|uniref:Lipoxygenase-like protein n=1 Tax=Leptotrombidium deliense TaxID=299467 RepID=A0A443RVH2_9ACAR|nr:lipoxygenase-like protein [Leptotrombidium deliense]